MEEVSRIGGEAERNQLKRRTELIGKPSLVVYHRKNVLSFQEIKHFFVGCNLNIMWLQILRYDEVVSIVL